MRIALSGVVSGSGAVACKSGVFVSTEGIDTASPARLGLRLVQGLPKALTQHFQVLILVDTAFGSVEFLTGIRRLKHHANAVVRCV